MADAKRKRAEGVEPEKGDYVRLSPSVADFMGGKRYCKESGAEPLRTKEGLKARLRFTGQ